MLQELFKLAISEKMSKQIIYKIPYLALISSILFLSLRFQSITVNSWMFILLLFVTHLATSFIFRKIFGRMEEELILLKDIKSFRKKLREIFEEGRSIFEDIRMGKVEILLFIVSGLTFSLFLVFILLFWFTSIHSETIIITVAMGSLIFVSYDIMKSDLLEEVKKNGKNPFIEDIIERYTLTNFLEKLPGERTIKDVLFKLIYRFLSPPLDLPPPKITFDMLMVYKTGKIDKLLKRYEKESDDENTNTNLYFYLKHVDGVSLRTIRGIESNGKSVEKISVLVERSPLENFPYLFDLDYGFEENKENKKWSMLEIVEKTTTDKNSPKVLGYVIVHAFKGCILKRKYKKDSLKTNIESRAVYSFIFIGLRDVISYLKKEIELRAPKFNQSMINVEVEDR